MAFLDQTDFFKHRKIIISTGIVFSGVCWYLSGGLTGTYWFLYWLAPVPVLFISFNIRGWQAFFIAFIAYLIGRLSWFSYLLTVVPIAVVILFTLIPSLVFAILIVAGRRIVLRSSHWSSAFVFPAFWVSFEYLIFLFSRDGTVGSIAYTQSNFLPLIQIASITGIQGITFLLIFFPSTIAVALFYRQDSRNVIRLFGVLGGLLSIVLISGIIRVTRRPFGKKVTVAMVAIDEKNYHNVYDPDPVNQLYIANLYLKEITTLATRAQVVIFPEKAIIVNDSTGTVIYRLLMNAAKSLHVTIIAGVTKIKKDYYENNAWVISEEGKLLTDYQKVNLFEGEAVEGFKPGNTIGLFHEGESKAGIAICKDLDFQQFMNKYGSEKIAILYAPAWDFVQDGWLHSRMAILRGVEGGYAIARNAREGRMSISDYRGKVLYEADCENKTHTALTGGAPVETNPTFYSKTGNWFSLLNIIVAGYFIFLMVRKKVVK
jgi:apolipoprotein N-acyltransferase